MIELYGNKIWNSNTPNKYKKLIIASEDSLDNICQELENSGLNYCAYIFNGEAHIAIGRATATNIDKLDIDYQTVIECNSKVYKTNNIIGPTILLRINYTVSTIPILPIKSVKDLLSKASFFQAEFTEKQQLLLLTSNMLIP